MFADDTLQILLDDNDRHFLRQCPHTIHNMPRARATQVMLRKLQRVRRLQSAGLISGSIRPDSTPELVIMDIRLTNKGRVAIKLPPLPDGAP